MDSVLARRPAPFKVQGVEATPDACAKLGAGRGVFGRAGPHTARRGRETGASNCGNVGHLVAKRQTDTNVGRKRPECRGNFPMATSKALALAMRLRSKDSHRG